MNKQEAIKYLEQHKYFDTCGQKSLEESNKAIDMAIEALSKDEITLEAPQELNEFIKDYVRCYMEKVGEELQKSRPHGEWIDREHCQVDEDAYEVAICSNCKAEITLEYSYDNFCPNCGADMRGEKE